MTVRVFHAPSPALVSGARLVLDADESHYLLRVRRTRVGEPLEVLDAEGGRWLATLAARNDAGVATIDIGEPIPRLPAGREVVLVLAVPEPSALLEALDAACAGGAASILLVQTRYSHATLPGHERIDRRLRATLRQCGRAAAPPCSGPVTLDEALCMRPELPGLIARPGADPGPPPTGAGARVLVGPEGGFTPEEERRIDAARFVPLSLGPWTLRTEMAVTAALSRVIAG